MITRGYIIGKIVDDIAVLKSQVETRNRLGLFDLTKFTEDFFKEVLNIVHDFNLQNLNVIRSNNPGIDLGDTQKKVAYQITSTRSGQKVKDTLTVLTPTQLVTYDNIKVFIVGEKQGSYSIGKKLLRATNFDTNRDIVDLDDMLRDVMVLPIEKLDTLLSHFNREFRALKVEFEIVDKDGNFESSLYNQLEKKPNQPPVNAAKLTDRFDDVVNFKSIKKLYRSLSETPRLSRELLAIIAERGKKYSFNHSRQEWGILPQSLQKLLRMTHAELEIELLILLDAKLIYMGEEYIDEKLCLFPALNYETINEVVDWAKENEISIRALFNTMDFTVLDE